MRSKGWTYSQAREYLHTPASVMWYRALITAVERSGSVADDGAPAEASA